MKIQFDYSNLHRRILEIWGSQKAFAKKMGMSTRTLSLKVDGLVQWRPADIDKAVKLLQLGDEDISTYFFQIITKATNEKIF